MLRHLSKSLLVLIFAGSSAFAERVVDADIILQAPTSEYGVIYSNTGMIPGRLQIYCKVFIDEASWDGRAPGDVKPCGGLDLQLRMSSLGLSAYFMNDPAREPMKINLHIDPRSATLRSVLGVYVGAKVGAGVAAGARTLILRNQNSGVWATTAQTQGTVDVGIDLSGTWLEVYLRDSIGNLNQKLSAFITDTKIQNPEKVPST